MSRNYLSTKNAMGVRLLSGVRGDSYVGFRAPAEAAPRGAMNPVLLGQMGLTEISQAQLIAQNHAVLVARAAQPHNVGVPPFATTPATGAPPVSAQTSPTPTVTVPPASPAPPVVTSGGGTSSVNTSAANTYTTDAAGDVYDVQTGQMVLTAAQAAAAGLTATALTQSNIAPSSLPAVAAAAVPATSTDLADQVTAWLSSTTDIFGYNVPNPLLAGGVVIVFAFLMGGKKK
jgi:hypothetical protein